MISAAIGALFSWTKMPQWALELIIIGAIGAGVWYWHHETYVAGIHAQRVADSVASAKAISRAAVATQVAQDAANRAEESYREEIARNAASAAHRPLGPVRLCIDAYTGGTNVPQASTAHSGNARPSSATGGIPGMPVGHPVVRQNRKGPDLEGLLGAWAIKADTVSAELREFQSRGNSP